jgi:hypothetical protein
VIDQTDPLVDLMENLAFLFTDCVGGTGRRRRLWREEIADAGVLKQEITSRHVSSQILS